MKLNQNAWCVCLEYPIGFLQVVDTWEYAESVGDGCARHNLINTKASNVK